MRLLILVALLVSATALAGTATVSWNHPTTNTDGSPIATSGDGALVATRIRYGLCSGGVFSGSTDSVNVAFPINSVLIDELAPGLWCFEAYARNGFGNESGASNLASKTVPAANVAPVITNPGNQSTYAGAGVNLQLVATDANGDALTFSATGLPTGIVLSAASGLITGSPTTAGSYSVTVTVTDAVGATDSASFTWSVLTPPTPNPPTIVTVETVAYEWNGKNANKVVGTIALGVPCIGEPLRVDRAGSWYELPLDKVTLTRMPKSAIVVGRCAA